MASSKGLQLLLRGEPVFLLGRMRIKEQAGINSHGCRVGFRLHQSANKPRSLILKVFSLISAFV